MKDSRLYLKDILEAIEAIEKFIKDKDFETFRKNDMISSAVIRKLEIIGEASKNILMISGKNILTCHGKT